MKFVRFSSIKNSDVCHQCMQPIDVENNESFVSSEKMACHVFCSDACMVFFMLNSTMTMDCLDCGIKTPFYHMVRSSMHPNQVWCSVHCYYRGMDSGMMVQEDETSKVFPW